MGTLPCLDQPPRNFRTRSLCKFGQLIERTLRLIWISGIDSYQNHFFFNMFCFMHISVSFSPADCKQKFLFVCTSKLLNKAHHKHRQRRIVFSIIEAVDDHQPLFRIQFFQVSKQSISLFISGIASAVNAETHDAARLQ